MAARRWFWACLLAIASTASAGAADDAQRARGAYLFNAGGCASCHTDPKLPDAPLGGGRALKTPFGTFYGPNITPHPAAGIGRWSDADFIRAMRHGIGPGGVHFYPVFPYTSFTWMTDADIRDLKAYIFSLPPLDKPSRPHDVGFPFNIRFLQAGWRMLNFTAGPFAPDPKASAQANRGAYLVRAVAHCGECHTPRNAIGGLKDSMWLAGVADGPEGEAAPNITPDPDTGIGKWSVEDIAFYLQAGVSPDGEFAGSLMGEVVANATSKLTAADRAAIAAYLKWVPPVANKVRDRRH